MLGTLILRVCLFAAAVSAFAQAPDGAAVYAKYCARCHEADNTGWSPRRAVLNKLPAETILTQLYAGLMAPIAATLSDAEKSAVAR